MCVWDSFCGVFMSDTGFDWRPLIFVLVLFLISYGLVFGLGSAVFNKWDSPMHWLVPIPAFFLAYWLFGWIEREFGISERSFLWPVLIVVLGGLAFFLAHLLYWCNGLTDIGAENTSCSGKGFSAAMNLIATQWSELVVRDAFFYFLIMVLLAWASRFVFLSALFPDSAKSVRKTRKTQKA